MITLHQISGNQQLHILQTCVLWFIDDSVCCTLTDLLNNIYMVNKMWINNFLFTIEPNIEPNIKHQLQSIRSK